MKKLILSLLLVFSINVLIAQNAEVSRDHNGSKTLKGFISKNDLATDTAFTWFSANQKNFTPDQNSLDVLKAKKDSINIVAFGGTWCDDTKQVLPQFYSLFDAAGLAENRITLLGVDRTKKSTQNLSEAFNITNVPTIIIMKNGKEVGRIIEYGKIGSPVKEFGQLLSAAK
jgi:thiol-disulfide isomerase/thioredoxin